MRYFLMFLGASVGLVSMTLLTLLASALIAPEANYEAILPYVLVAAFFGLLLGAYLVKRFLRK